MAHTEQVQPISTLLHGPGIKITLRDFQSFFINISYLGHVTRLAQLAISPYLLDMVGDLKRTTKITKLQSIAAFCNVFQRFGHVIEITVVRTNRRQRGDALMHFQTITKESLLDLRHYSRNYSSHQCFVCLDHGVPMNSTKTPAIVNLTGFDFKSTQKDPSIPSCIGGGHSTTQNLPIIPRITKVSLWLPYIENTNLQIRS